MTDDLRIAELPAGAMDGIIGNTFAPGKKQASGLTGPHDRDLAADLDAVAARGAAAAVTPMQADEFEGAPKTFVPNENLPVTVVHHPPAEDEGTGHLPPEIAAALNDCLSVGDGQGIFDNSWRSRVNEVLIPSNRLFCGFRHDPKLIVDVARQGGLKTTKATERNPALVAIKLSARPKDVDEEKLCSDWAMVLLHAEAEQIKVEDFGTWIEGVKVRDCKHAMAERKRAAKAGILQAKPVGANSTGVKQVGPAVRQPPRLELHLHGVDGPTTEAVELPEVMYPTLLAALMGPGTQSQLAKRLGESLLMLADELAAAEGSGTSSMPSTGEPEVIPAAELADG